MRHCFRAIASTAAIALSAAIAFAADSPPLSGIWNIAPTGSAASSGELLFRVMPAGAESMSVAVSVMSGETELQVAREIQSRFAAQLPPDRFNVELGEGANVLVTDRRSRPNFSLELVDSGVQNLRVAVRSVAPAASPTVREQELPADPPNSAPPTNTAPGAAIPPPATTIAPPTSSMPPPASSMPPPANTIPVPPPAPADPAAPVSPAPPAKPPAEGKSASPPP